MFYCPSITDLCQKYDVAGNSYSTCAPMLVDRYRHAAVGISTSIYVIGGRDMDDNLITSIDKYDTVTNEWTSKLASFDSITSDAAVYSVGTDLFIVGGYEADYTASDKVWKIDTTQETWVPEPAAKLNSGRGDVFTVVAGDHVFVTGGFTHEDNFCNALKSVEKKPINGGEWTHVAENLVGRGDKALVHLNERIFAIGGETKVNCASTSTPVHDVEVYDVEHDSWKVATSIPEETFR